MSERVVETQVIEIKVRGATGITALEAAAQKAQAMLAEARKRLDALAKSQKGFGPPTQIEAAADAVKDLGAAAKQTQAAVVAATKAQRTEAQAAAKATREASQAEKARTREAVSAARERARAVAQAERAASAASKEASERSRAAMENAVDAARKYARAIDEARAKAEALSNVVSKSRFSGLAGAAGSGLKAGASAIGAGALAAVTGATTIGGGVLQQVVSRGSDFAANRAALSSNLGGDQAATDQIAGLRAVRGLGVDDGIKTSNRLAGLGLDASVGSVKNLASIAAGSPGKTTSDVAEALADAGTGETERLKEFGIKAKSVGDQFEVTFKGITTTIEKGSASWQAYLGQIAESDFGNTLELKANSLAGGIESLQDKITAAASAVYDSGLGEAIQAVVADIGSYFEISGEGAKGLGSVLGEAVKNLWARIKELIGPVGELPGKIEKVINVATSFAEVIFKVIGTLGKITETLGTTGTAFTALGAAGLAAFGPWGAAAAAAVAAISLISGALEDTTQKAKLLEEQTKQLGKTQELQKRLAADLEFDYEDSGSERRLNAERAQLQKDKEANSRASGILSPAALKKEQAVRAEAAIGIAAREAKLKEEEERLARNKRERTKKKEQEEKAAAAAEVKAAEDASQLISDTEEFDYLARKKSKTPSQKKRLAELSEKLNKSLPEKGKKDPISAYQAEVEAEIKSRAQDAGRVAGLRANRNGASKAESDAIALRTEKETTERLKSQVDRGQLLPGQIQANVLALARVEDVASRGTPPPIAVTNVGPVTVNVPVSVTGNTIDADARQIEVATRRVVKGVMVEETRDAIRRITSGVRG